MGRSLVLLALAVAGIVALVTWQPDRDEPPAPPESALVLPGRVMACPPPEVQEGPGFLPPGVHENLEATRDTIMGDRARLAEIGVYIAAVRLDPEAQRVRVVVPDNLPLAAGYLAEITDSGLVCIEVGGVLE